MNHNCLSTYQLEVRISMSTFSLIEKEVKNCILIVVELHNLLGGEMDFCCD